MSSYLIHKNKVLNLIVLLPKMFNCLFHIALMNAFTHMCAWLSKSSLSEEIEFVWSINIRMGGIGVKVNSLHFKPRLVGRVQWESWRICPLCRSWNLKRKKTSPSGSCINANICIYSCFCFKGAARRTFMPKYHHSFKALDRYCTASSTAIWNVSILSEQNKNLSRFKLS